MIADLQRDNLDSAVPEKVHNLVARRAVVGAATTWTSTEPSTWKVAASAISADSRYHTKNNTACHSPHKT